MPTTVLPLPPTTDVQIVRVVKALFDAAPGYTYLTAFKDFANTNGGVAALANALVGVTGKSGNDLADLIVTNLKLTGDAATVAKAYLAPQFAAPNANAGQIIVDAMNVLASLGNDPTFGAAANAFNASVAKAYAYSTNPANTTTDLATLQQADEEQPVIGQTFTLTPGTDRFNGTAGADILRGVAGTPVGVQDQTTLNSSDVLDGADGDDTLVVLLNGDYGGGATIKNIETLQLGTNNAAVEFDYNVNAGLYEVIGVNTVVFDQITAGERLNVVNITPTAAGNVIPTLKWDNEPGSRAGVVGVDFRQASVAGPTTQLNIILDDVNNGVFNIGPGIEILKITSQGSTPNVLRPSTDYNDNGGRFNVDLLSGRGNPAIDDDNSLTKVIIDGAQAFGRAPGIVADATDPNYGLTDRQVNSDDGLTPAATASNLISVAATVTEVDASAATGNIALRFTQKANNSDTNVTFKGGKGNDYVEFERGAVKATGGEGDDTFAFITLADGVTNSGFGSTDTIDGGPGTDTIQIGLNGVGTYTLSTTEFSNKTGIDVLDLRGANNNVTVSSQFVAAADPGVKLTIRTDRIVQTSASDPANPVGANTAENNSTSIINLTNLAINQGVKVIGGSGSERIVVNDAAMNANVEIDGGANGGVAGRYDTITVLDSAVLDAGDLANVKGIEALILAETVTGNSTFRIDLTEAFLLNNTSRADAANTSINDATFRIGTANSLSGTALNAGDTVTIDISDLLNPARTALKASLAGRGIDVALGGATVNYVVDGKAATPAQIALVTVADANRADAVVASAAGAGTGGGTGGGATGNPITVPTSSGNATVAATAGRDIFTFDVATALADASGQNTQVTINGFTTGTSATSDVLRLDLPTANPQITTLAQLNGQQGVFVQVDPFANSTLINFGNDANGGEPVTITLAGIVDPAQVAVEVV
jgi:hypothetical protein